MSKMVILQYDHFGRFYNRSKMREKQSENDKKKKEMKLNQNI